MKIKHNKTYTLHLSESELYLLKMFACNQTLGGPNKSAAERFIVLISSIVSSAPEFFAASDTFE